MKTVVITRPVVLCLLFLIPLSTFGQKKKKKVRPVVDTVTIYHDVFTGNIQHEDCIVATTLELDHKLYHDMGSFSLDEVYKKPGRDMPKHSQGEWTVLRETLDDEDITVVELDKQDGEALFFWRKNDSTLLKMTAQKEPMSPAISYSLAKTGKDKIPAAKKKDTASLFEVNMQKLRGTYKGKLPCADCKGITSTLTLNYKPHAKNGDYTVADIYLETSRGDINNQRKGRWRYEMKQIEADRKSIVVVLDYDKPGRESYYFLKKDGNLIQIDRDLKRIQSPVDQTMRKLK